VYVHLKSAGRLARVTLEHRPTWRRGAAFALGGALHGSLGAAVSAARALDHLLFPGFRGVAVRSPLFIVATPRSGTTYLHHLLALDEQHFAHFRLYQTVFPAVVAQRAVDLLRALQRSTGVGLGGLLRALNRRILPGWDGIHEVRLDEEEEDEALFVYALLSPALYLLVPFIEQYPELARVDELPPAVLDKLTADYIATLRRRLHTAGPSASGAARRMLVKNVLLPSRLGALERALPDARFVRLVRAPERAIPSAMSMFFRAWQAHSPDIAADSPETLALAKMFCAHYRLLGEHAAQSPERYLTVRFEDFVARPVETVESIYAWLGLPLTDEYRAALESAVASRGAHRSAHDYDLEDFGLTRELLRSEIGPTLATLGY
jgi:hypothetical protein